MANMGYCRFENTFKDLLDCNDHLFDDDLSDSEQEARRKLVALCRQIAAEYEDVEEDDEE